MTYQQPQPPRLTPAQHLIPNPFPWWAHMIHAALTLLSCFLWSPIWIAHVSLHKKHKYVNTYR